MLLWLLRCYLMLIVFVYRRWIAATSAAKMIEVSNIPLLSFSLLIFILLCWQREDLCRVVCSMAHDTIVMYVLCWELKSQVIFSQGRIQDFFMWILMGQRYKHTTAKDCISTSGVLGMVFREILKRLEEACHWKTHGGCLFVVMLTFAFDSRINGFPGIMIEHFCVKSGDPSCIGFRDIVQIKRQETSNSMCGKCWWQNPKFRFRGELYSLRVLSI